jgi:prepilin-type N-terminal cleavage/methylation domain-containing protein
MSNTYNYHHPIHSKQTYHSNKRGFTIVELLIVIVVIAILAAISIVAYNGIQDRAKNIRVQSDIKQVATLIEMYYAQEGTYPSTGSLSNVYSDANCTFAADSNGAKTKTVFSLLASDLESFTKLANFCSKLSKLSLMTFEGRSPSSISFFTKINIRFIFIFL